MSDREGRDLIRRWLASGTNLLLVVVTLAGVVATALLSPAAQVFALKLAAIVLLASLPGLLYLQFLQQKALSLYDEYVLNLYRMRIDRVGALPKPPPGSGALYEEWRRRQPEDAEPGHNVYLRKFEAVYGHNAVPESRRVLRDDGLRPRDHVLAARADVSFPPPFSPVLLLVLVYVVGWAAVLHPELYRDVGLLGGVELSGLPDLPTDALRYGFVGAYAFSLQCLVRRYFGSDLRVGAYVSALARVIYVALLVAVVGLLVPPGDGLHVVAFVIGFFPNVGWQLVRRGAEKLLGFAVPSLESKHRLSDLDGMSVWTEARLLEEGIEDLQNLATANLVDLLLQTRIPADRLVDWVDQALLLIRLEPEEAGEVRRTLRQCGIRTATDFLDGTDPAAAPSFVAELRAALGDRGLVLEGLRRSLLGEVNLVHVRAWRSADWLSEDAPGSQDAHRADRDRGGDIAATGAQILLRSTTVLPSAPPAQRHRFRSRRQ